MTTMADARNSEGSVGPKGATEASLASASEIRHRFLRGLLYREWLVTRNWQEWFLMIWLLGLWVLVIFYNPYFILAFGLVYAVVAGPVFGGMDVSDGSEEFTLALPPTRQHRFLTRLALGGGALILLDGIGLAAIGWDLPQRLWGLVVETGLTEPFPSVRVGSHYVLAFCAPLAVFGVGFSMTALSHSSDTAPMRGWVSLLVCAAVWGGAKILERVVGKYSFGWFPALAVLGFGLACVAVAFLLYLRKEAVARPGTTEGGDPGSGWPVLLGAVLIGLFVALAVGVAGVRRPAHVSSAPLTVRSVPASVTGVIQPH